MKKKIIIGLVVIALIVAARMLGLDRYLNIEFLLEQRSVLLNFVDQYFILTSIGFIMIYILAVAFSVPGATILSITSGLLFGVFVGLIYVNIGATIGATINFLLARYVIGDSIQNKYGESLEKFNKEINKNCKNYLLTLRLIPVFPFFLINVLAGVASVKLRTFIWTTAVGIIPGSIFYVYAGTTLKHAEALTDFISWKTTLPLVLLGILAFLPVIINKIKEKKQVQNG